MSEFAGSPAPADWTPPSVEALAALLPQYEIEAMLGVGGMGAVYRGRQRSLNRKVAIKILPETLARGSGEDVHRFSERFRREARAMAGLDHPAILSVYDFGETTAGQLYIVMEFVDGMDIEEYIRASGGKVESEHALAIVSHVLDALDYAHARGIVHRDIKPANVLIDQTGRIKIADFGLAKRLVDGDGVPVPEQSGLTLADAAIGTPEYMAPEVFESEVEPDHRADLYAVGVMLYRMLTGRLPRGVFRLPSELNTELDPRLDDMVAQAMASRPEKRHASAGEFRAAISEVLSRPVTKLQAGATDGAAAPAVGRTRLVAAQRARDRNEPEPDDSPDPREPGGRARQVGSILLGSLVVVALVAAGWMIGGDSDSTPPTPMEVGEIATADAGQSNGAEGGGANTGRTGSDDPPAGSVAGLVRAEATGRADDIGDVGVTSADDLPWKPAENQPASRTDGLVADGKWHDVLSAIGNRPSFSTHEWEFEGGVLSGSVPAGKQQAVRGIEVEPIDTYEARMLFELEDGADAVSMFLPTPKGGLSVFLWDSRKRVAIQGQGVDPATTGTLPLGIQDGGIHAMHVRVVRDRLEVLVDGLPALDVEIDDWNRWDQRLFYGSGKPPLLGLRFAVRSAKFYSYHVRIPVPGESLPPLPAKPAPYKPGGSRSGSSTASGLGNRPPPASPGLPPEIDELRLRVRNFQSARSEKLAETVESYRSRLATELEEARRRGDAARIGSATAAEAALVQFVEQVRNILGQETVEPLPSLESTTPSSPQIRRLEYSLFNSCDRVDSDLLGQLVSSLQLCSEELVAAGRDRDAGRVDAYSNRLSAYLRAVAGQHRGDFMVNYRENPFVLRHENSRNVTIVSEVAAKAFADQVVATDSGIRAVEDDGPEPGAALGVPNFATFEDDRFFYSLGRGGWGVWSFRDNGLTDGPGDDLLVVEVGDDSEQAVVEISTDGQAWLSLGNFDGGSKSFDIAGRGMAGAAYTQVRIRDLLDQADQKPGPDIDAIAALNGAGIVRAGGAPGSGPAVDSSGRVGHHLPFVDSSGSRIEATIATFAFLDAVVDHDFGVLDPWPSADDPGKALGPTDLRDVGDQAKFYSLGWSGAATWRFVDNGLVDGPGDDLVIFEHGPVIEPFVIQLSGDGERWKTLGIGKGTARSYDLSELSAAGSQQSEIFRFVRLADLSIGMPNIPGPEIDAVAALNGVDANGQRYETPQTRVSDPSFAVAYTDSQGQAVKVDSTAVRFIDKAVEHDFGNAAPIASASDPARATGPLEQESPASGHRWFSVGSHGVATWRFMDTALVDGPGDDLVVFEFGPGGESVGVELSTDGSTWLDAGKLGDGARALDLSGIEGGDPEQAYYFVRIRDLGGNGGDYPGADIDAIAALNWVDEEASP